VLTTQATERALGRALPAVGASRRAVPPLLAGWLAGAMPIVSGHAALNVLETCGRVLTGDRVVMIDIHPTLTRPAQIFGRIHPESGALIPTASRLPDILLDAMSEAGRDRLALVIFRGVNRSTLGSFLLPLLNRRAARHGPPAPRPLGDLLPGRLDPDDPYAALASSAWPANVLLAATLSEGDPIVPLPASIWPHCTYVCLDHLPQQVGPEHPDHRAGGHPMLPVRPSFVPFELWQTWTAAIRREADLSACAMPEAGVPNGRGDVVASWRMFETALRAIGGEATDGHYGSLLLHHVVAPWAMTAGLSGELAQLVASQESTMSPSPFRNRPVCACLDRACQGTLVRKPGHQCSRAGGIS
jgi:hypothetical protein